MPFCASAQDADRPFEALRQKLRLTEAQMKRLQSPRVLAPTVATGVSRSARRSERSSSADAHNEEFVGSRGVLIPSQEAELTLIARVLESGQAAREAVQLGLINSFEWPGGGQCFDPDPRYEALGLGLTADQIAQLDRIGAANWSEARVSDVRLSLEQRRLRELMNSGMPDESAIRQARADFASERNYAQTTFREPARTVLDGLQRQRLEAFESELELASEAVALNLLMAPGGEVFCH